MDENKTIEDLLDYWMKRCIAAELFIAKSPCDPDITKEQIEAYKIWQAFKDTEEWIYSTAS